MSYVSLQEAISIKGKIAIVTGAGVGIGKAIAERLHEAGASVALWDLSKEAIDQLASELNEKRAGSAVSYGMDVSVSDDVEAAFSHVIESFGTVDILVNNAGIYPIKTFEEMSEADFQKVIDVNLKGLYLCTKQVVATMKERGGGKIINVTSIDALHPSMVGLAHYDASKHGAWGFTKNIALELAPYGIAVNAIAPGAIATPGTGVVDGNVPDALQGFIQMIPMGRMGDADEIGKVAAFLASDLASYMTGSQIVVDGGRLLR
jgi:2-deoxy-D-gluconate 3-dehydrogenase